jgi:hypothetical protein
VCDVLHDVDTELKVAYVMGYEDSQNNRLVAPGYTVKALYCQKNPNTPEALRPGFRMKAQTV